MRRGGSRTRRARSWGARAPPSLDAGKDEERRIHQGWVGAGMAGGEGMIGAEMAGGEGVGARRGIRQGWVCRRRGSQGGRGVVRAGGGRRARGGGDYRFVKIFKVHFNQQNSPRKCKSIQ
ncbi:hypothetical protein ZWY2020_054042 [Hordeum vulgare]|nr:hypothetical protein ZWY2020_054042 [Hordeum vulgare]